MIKINQRIDKNISGYIPDGISRRQFLKRLGGGVIVAVAISDFSDLEAAVLQEMPTDLNAFLRVSLDGRVTCFTGKIEMGQGVVTSLAQMIAEELDVQLENVDMVMGDTDLCPYDRGTWGSMTTRFFGPALRSAAAEARAVLIQMAAEKLKVPVTQLKVENGTVMDSNNPKSKITYAELTKGNKIVKTLSEKPELKDPSQFKVIGKSVKRMDGKIKVTGEAKFAGDIRLPGMVYASIFRPPSHESKLKSLDTTAIDHIEGLTLIRDNDLVAVLHEDPEYAQACLAKINAVYDTPDSTLNENTIFDHLLKMAPEGEMVAEGGNLGEGEGMAKKVLESEYHDGYYSHSPMEPHTALAVMEGDRMKIWASTQSPFGLKSEVAQVLGMSPDKVHVQPAFVGGGFGGKSNNRQGVEAARLAKLSGKPVMLVWTRREEFAYDALRPAAVIKIKSGVTSAGKIASWDYKVYFAGTRGASQFYDIPNHKTTVYNSGWRAREGVHPFATGAWRAPGNNTNTFARESHINFLAAEAGVDPLEFRLKNLKDERMIETLKAVADKFGWIPLKSPSGKGYGIACGTDAGAYVAHMAEVKVDRQTGHVQVLRVVCAQDMGLVINPQGATIQMEGCITMGLGYALSEEIKFTGGMMHTRNFDTYKIPRFSMLPDIQTVLVKSKDTNAQGGGEPAIICMGALIANAIYDATGARLFRMPMTPERVLEAIKKS
ncbi:MAG TPA: molybdopterin cofactor-binding domain-containing protein [Cyclobacteriaceae bacterium]|nr:molybdopterin cofactor-binding domain-containing protein [Cyclobacteriaceae bacterium]